MSKLDLDERKMNKNLERSVNERFGVKYDNLSSQDHRQPNKIRWQQNPQPNTTNKGAYDK